MAISPRHVAAICVGALVALTLAALVFSIETATSDGDARLHSAAAAIVDSSGFRVLISAASATQRALPPTQATRSSLSDVALISYQSPDRVEIVSRSQLGSEQLQVAVGKRAWESLDGRTYIALTVTHRGTSVGLTQANILLRLARQLEKATGTAVNGDVITFTTTLPDVLESIGLSNTGLPVHGTTTTVRTVISNGVLSEVSAAFVFNGRSLLLDEEYSAIGHVRIEPPPPGSISKS